MRCLFLGISMSVAATGCADLVEGGTEQLTDGSDDDDGDEGEDAGSVTLTGTPLTTSGSTTAPPTTGAETTGMDPTGDPGTSTDPESTSTDPTIDPTTTTDAESSSSTGEPLDPKFADCFNLGEDICEPGETCVYDYLASPGGAVCLQVDCGDSSECPDAPPGGEALPTCGGVATSDGDECYLDCSGGEACPTGMVCINEVLCMWPQQGMAQENFFSEIPPNWTLYDEDGHTPDTQVSFIDEAWVASNWAGPWAALSTSFYSPAAAADDWLVTPPIAISDASVVSFEAAAVDGDFADGYEVRISTATNAVADFLANPALLTIAGENTSLTVRTIDLSAEGYEDQVIYLAWRNNSDDKFVLVIDDVEVSY